MIHGQALPQSRRFFDHVVIIARLRTIQRGLKQPEITNALCAAIAFDLVVMDCQDLNNGQVIRHSASFA